MLTILSPEIYTPIEPSQFKLRMFPKSETHWYNKEYGFGLGRKDYTLDPELGIMIPVDSNELAIPRHSFKTTRKPICPTRKLDRAVELSTLDELEELLLYLNTSA